MVDNKDFKILSMDKDLYLIQKMKSTYTPYVVCVNLNMDNFTWAFGHYFTNYEDAHEFFLEYSIRENTTNPYEFLFKTTLRNELESRSIDFNYNDIERTYRKFMQLDDFTTFLDERIIKSFIREKELSENKLDIGKMGIIIQDIVEQAKNSESNTWFIEKEQFTQYSKEDWLYFLDDLDELNSFVDDLDCIVEFCGNSVDEIEQASMNNDCDCLATFYGDFLRLFMTEEEYEEYNNSSDEQCI